jgi:hypothetical protein
MLGLHEAQFLNLDTIGSPTCKRSITLIIIEVVESRDGIYGRYLLVILRTLAIEGVGSVASETATHMEHAAMQAGPLLHLGLGRMVFHVPLHGDTLDIGLVARLAPVQYLGTPPGIVAHLNRIPRPRAPELALSLGHAVDGTACIVRLLDIAPLVIDIHKAALLAVAEDVTDGSSTRKILPHSHVAIPNGEEGGHGLCPDARRSTEKKEA